MTIPLVLGPILFDETSLETPENLAAATSVRMAVRDFPGGLRTIQTFGVFPDPIKFRGKILRPDMLDRAAFMKAVVAAQQPVAFTYGPLYWTGIVRAFHPVVLNQWRAEYEIEFVPQSDAGLASQDDGAPSAEQQLSDQTSGLQSTTGATQSGVFAPAGSDLANQLDANPEAFSAGGYSFGPVYAANADGTPIASDGTEIDLPLPGVTPTLAQPAGTFASDGLSFGPSYVAAPDGTPLPTQLASATGSLLGAVGTGLQVAGGVVANIGQAAAVTIGAAAQTLATTAGAIVASPQVSAGLAYAAAMTQANATAIAGLVGASASTQWTVNVVNPNLMLLASQYYGDPDQWQTIANANDLSDPQPLGQYQLSIPAAA